MKKSPERFRFFFRSGQVRSLMILAILFVAQTYVLHAASFKEASFPQKPETAAIEGTVKNSKGAPIAGATLILEEKGASKTIEAKTNAEGAYVLKTDHAGIYTVRVGKSGWLDTVADAIQLSIGEKKHIDLVLTPDDSVKLKSSARLPSKNEPVGAMEFADEPNFTVAGITDWSNLGLHGSAASSQTSETLAKQTLALKPVNSTASESVARTRYEAATVLSSKGEYARARDEVRKLLASSNDAEGHRFLGELDEKLGDPLSAVHEYQQAARMDPSEQNYFEWGTELLLHKAADPAAEVFTNGAHAHPKSARMLAGLGAALFANGSWEEAARRLCDASDLEPADAAPYLFLGKIEMATPGPLPCSEEKLTRFAQEQPENALANYYYAVSLW
ncbi:MAG: carboxypeptidase regulatory-like domain-containing protein, partial [Candidatus Acidiferrum sp.]